MRCAIGTVAARASLVIAAAALVLLTFPGTPRATADTAQVPGMDVSGHQGNVDWQAAWAAGARFAYIKATEGTSYRNPYFTQQYSGSYDVGMIRGAYHFARPDISDGPTQANFFVARGGAWSPDGRTLPPMLDIEYNPYGQTCYGLSPAAMTGWIKSFSETVHAKTSRWPMIYTTTDWWKTCTGNSAAFGDTHPLFIARYADSPGPLPSGWRYYSMWQYSDSGNKPGDQDTFNGSMEQLIKFAGGEQAGNTVVTTTPAPTTTATPAPTSTSSPTSTTTTPPATTTTAEGARAEPVAPSTTSASATTSPTSQTTARVKPISGLVWVAQRTANPPQSLRANDNSDELRARQDTADDTLSTPSSTVSTSTASPEPSVGTASQQPSVSQAEAAPRPLANTGTSAPRVIVFGAALLLLGTILVFLARIAIRR